MKGYISKSTAALLAVIAMLVGALVVTITTTHRIPVFLDTAHAATADAEVPFTTFAPVVKRAMPAVVNISSSKVVKDQGDAGKAFSTIRYSGSFSATVHRNSEQPRSERATSLGSGVVVSPDGYIITNNHVVDGATDVKVSFADKEEYPAKVIGTDKYTDIAVLKINRTGLTTLPFANSAHAEVGDVVLAIGEPFGLGQTVTMGIISAKGRAGLGIERFEDFIQTDAAINRGNSGGALIDTHGELVGINTAILSGETGGNQGIGFAIPANLARNIMDQIMKNGKVTRGFMGITPAGADAGHGEGLRHAERPWRGHLEVEPKSPAASGWAEGRRCDHRRQRQPGGRREYVPPGDRRLRSWQPLCTSRWIATARRWTSP